MHSPLRPLRPLRHLLAAALAALCATGHAGEIAVIVKTTNSTYWQNVNKGAEAAMKDVPGHTMTFAGPASESAIAEQVNLVENAVNRRVAGIVLAPSDPDALVPVMKKAWEARIPVVLIDSQVAEAGRKYYQSFLTTDNRAAGELCAKQLIAKVGTTGKVAIMSYVAGAGSEVDRVGAFKNYLKANSKLQVVGPFYSQSQMATAMNQTTDLLAAHRDLKGIFGANEPTAVGMGRAIVQAGRAGKLVAVGFDGNQDLQKFVQDGTLTGIAVQGSFQMGELGVKTVNDLLQKKPVPKFRDTGVVWVDKANLETPEARAVLY
ncbi:ABC transporter substrate-binding protein [Pelomonas cellulosilytica]|uniref:ABC transporter substrate-binding protein n=1 Tax=Pelomonas cellulosilytica TaxID=2906762 RepID=A0ABS8Y444_9BURK|nr:ABC transporter substrate-binding protein [Pelomonas sp. P8]MCE4557886.1 ABC transporter substrate-binding protein [Pelomonas sp. P8]